MKPTNLEEEAFLLRAQLAQSHNNEAKMEMYIIRLKRENDALRSENKSLLGRVSTEIIKK